MGEKREVTHQREKGAEGMLAMVVAAVAAGYDDGGVVAITVEGCVDRWSSDVTGRGMLRRHGDRQRTRPSSSR